MKALGSRDTLGSKENKTSVKVGERFKTLEVPKLEIEMMFAISSLDSFHFEILKGLCCEKRFINDQIQYKLL